MPSKATTVKAYLAEIAPDRRRELEKVLTVMRRNLDRDFAEEMQYGMVSFNVPHRIYPPGYHCDPRQPLPFAGAAARKNHLSLHMMHIYGDAARADAFKRAWTKTGKKLDMGKACIRFRSADDLALDVIASTLRAVTAKGWVKTYEAMLASAGLAHPGAKKAGAKKVGATKRGASKHGVRRSGAKSARPARTKAVATAGTRRAR